jgi:Txe/YoeB family toxin of Txe-Axe toxin-antitoxin module
MEVSFTEKADRDLEGMEQTLRKLFIKHIDKLMDMPPRRHMRFGIPFNIEDVTEQARMVYWVEDKNIYVIRCFKNHKEYERWYKSYR